MYGEYLRRTDYRMCVTLPAVQPRNLAGAIRSSMTDNCETVNTHQRTPADSGQSTLDGFDCTV